MDVHGASDLLARGFASLSLASSPSWTTLGVKRTSSRHFTTAQRRALAHPDCRSCRSFSSSTARREGEPAGKQDSQPSYKADIYQRRSAFADDLYPNARLAPKDGARSSGPSSPSVGPPGSLDNPATESSRASKPDESQSTAQASSEVSTRKSWATPRQRSTIGPNYASRYGIENINFPENPAGATHIKAAPRPRVIQELDIHVKPRTGRTLAVNQQMPADLGKKLRMLDILVSRNRIRYEFRRQQFHERPGLRRKRLVSERWRRKFKTMFQTTANRVSDLKHQGW